METEQKNKVMEILPKGKIFLALGGYTKAIEDPSIHQKAEAISSELIKCLGDQSCIVVIDGGLRFRKFKKSHNFFQLFRKFFKNT